MRSGALLFLIAGLVFSLGCFQTRRVEPPSSNASEWVTPSDYQILLDNFRTAIARNNVQNYLRCLSQDKFQFIAAARLFNDQESIWQNWSRQDEQVWFENMLADLAVNSGNGLILEQTDLQDVTADSVKYVGTYTLRVNHQDSVLTTLFTGQIQLLMQLNDFNEWEIRRWEDIEIARDSSWSQLKLEYIQ